MAEQTFRSPGFFDQEIDLSGRQVEASGIPAGVVGTAEKGPAFVPVTVGSFADFETKFGSLDPKRFGPYAVQKWLENRTACTYVRVLGAGANETAAQISNTRTAGIVSNAGFVVSGTVSADGTVVSSEGDVQFIIAKHDASTNEANGFPVLTDNSSIQNASEANLVRGMVLLASGTRLLTIDNDAFYSSVSTDAKVGAIAGSPLTQEKYFKLVISSSADTFGNDESEAGVRILTASLDPNDGVYIGKVLNTNPLRFQQEQHLLYMDFAVEHDLAPVIAGSNFDNGPTVAVVSGSALTSGDSGLSSVPFESLFGRFDTRYTTPRTTSFISQPYGKSEYDLFHFETIDDGAYANEKYKISIAAVKASTNKKQPFGSFEVQVRAFDDSDTDSAILERFPNCSLDPTSDRYIARLIGDKKVRFDFDQEDPEERRLVVTGKYPNVSARIRVVMNEQVERAQVPKDALPFGFRGVPALKTTDSLTDSATALAVDGTTYGAAAINRTAEPPLGATGSILPPMPYRVKVTRGAVSSSPAFLGDTGDDERVDGRLYWGVKTAPVPVDSTTDSIFGITNAVLNANVGAGINPLVRAYTKFQGIEKLDTLVTGSGKDVFNDNKFTLSRVALYNAATTLADVTVQVTGTAGEHMLEAAYVRNGIPDSVTYTVGDGTRSNRITLASLVATSSALFNRFTGFAKFTNVFYGGFDGVNILDEDMFYFRDRSLSADTGGKNVETAATQNIGLNTNPSGFGRRNNQVFSLREGIDIISNPISTRINLLAVPGVREPYVTDHAAEAVKDYGLAMYVMDVPEYDKDAARLYDNSTGRSNVSNTIDQFESRVIDNNYVAVYFPDVTIDDDVNNRVVEVPPSVAALGALGFNDRTQQVWFAPAGFNRGALDFVNNVENRLSSADRDDLYDARINPIATFPRAGFVVFGQKTLQVAQSALDRINVRRMLIDVKRRIGGIAQRLVFEQNNAATRARFVAEAVQQLTAVQSGQGIEAFKVVCDETNNTAAEIEQNRMRGQIQVVPTRAVEFIAVDFIVTNSGVTFE
jgi:hypothetical protein